ncbi:DUF6124 family protein [Pseudomonas sp. H9]|uniref:DUF6124 family protein n=1 Tax=Pseudomonas sp. H9 TaxID=483968 RepID=UPI00105810C6|nr:hypothetical protein [Pseudomonas sp. H9]TDF82489.1 hypothetical protein E1573_15115 [Pseudomonas sp. H9]
MTQFPADKDIPLDNESLSSSDAARRALDFYLNPTPPAESALACWLVPREGLDETQATEHVTQLLRCAAATAQESASGLQGIHRDLALTVVHMINIAKTVLEHLPAARQRS